MERKKWAEAFLAECENKIYNVIDDIGIDYPMDLRRNAKKYEEVNHPPYHWGSGFLGGMMWLLYFQTGKEKYKERAIKCSKHHQEVFSNNKYFPYIDNHDLGFAHHLTSVTHYKFSGDEDAKVRGLHAATMLAGRFNPNGEFLRAWDLNKTCGDDVRGFAIIDCLMNLPLLYWATDESGDPRFKAIGKKHADMAAREFVKPDGSVYHIVNFNPDTGEVTDYPRGQGYKSGSSWSRGQAWGVYGFMISYIHTKDRKYVDTAKGIADYIIANIGDYKIVPSDYMQPAEPRIIDSSASAITACGMIELARALGKNDGQKYEEFAIWLLENLYEDCDFSDKNQAILQSSRELYHGEGSFPIVYADYFLIEALMKIIEKTDFFMW